LLERGGSVHKSKGLPDDLVRFSFRHYTPCEKFDLPDGVRTGPYVEALLERMREISGMRLSEFMRPGNTLRSHHHDWHDTSEQEGYKHLSKQLQGCSPWQFSVSSNAHGRVHGILIDDVFYVVWLDPEHRLYS
jgi:hypothetical protein